MFCFPEFLNYFRRLRLHYNTSFTILSLPLSIWTIERNYSVIFILVKDKISAWVQVIDIIEIILFALLILATTFETFLESKYRIIDSEDHCNFIIDLNVNKIDRKLIMIHIGFYIFLVFILSLLFIFQYTNLKIQQLIVIFLGQFYLLTNELEFVKSVTNIKNKFKKFNQQLNNSFRKQPRNFRACSITYEKCNVGRNPTDLHDFCNLHWLLCEKIAIINNTYRFRISLVVICIFYEMVTMPYKLLVSLIKNDSKIIMREITSTFLLAFHVCELLYLVLSTDSATKEANKTKVILCKHLQDSEMECKLDDFLAFLTRIQVHELEFYVANLFVLDKSFILKVLGAGTTYMIIFIQLQDSVNLTRVLKPT